MSEPDATAQGTVRGWNRGWQRYAFPGLWLIYLGQTGTGVREHSDGAAQVVGYVVLAAFAVVYLTALPVGWSGMHRRFWWLYAAAAALTVVECFFAHGDALVFLVYLSVLTVATRRRWAPLAVGGYVLVSLFLPPLVPAWDTGIAWDLGVVTALVSLAMFGFFAVVESNIALARARAEVARLAAENERSRIARDLHDLLGHSLTTITVKAGLARKLAERGEDDRARAEIGEVEQLARRTLGDVRAAVSSHREITLAGELATAREVLRASGIIAELPASVAEVDADVDQLFGWVVREGVTNAVRHSRAQHVRVTFGPRRLEVADDGRGGSAVPGNGLTGLRERVEAVGGTLEIHQGDGFRLCVDVPVPAVAPTPAAVP
ncbi:sensor histidine kinase [Jatrophihabitans fulvus]